MERNSNPIIESDNISYYTFNGMQGVLVHEEVAEEYGIELSSEYYDLDYCFVPFVSIPEQMLRDILSGRCEVERIASHEYYDIRGEGESINTFECTCFENPQRIEDRWEDEEFALNDESERKLLVKTTKYFDWASERSRITDLICKAMVKYDNSKKSDLDKEVFNERIAELREDWAAAVKVWTVSTPFTDWTAPSSAELERDANEMLGY